MDAASPVYAHTIGGEGGAELELLLVGVVVIIFSFSLRSSQIAKRWVPWAVLGLGVVVLTSAFVVPRATGTAGTSNAELSIVSPRPGAEVPAGRPVRIEVEVANAPVADSPSATSGGHLHLYVNGELEQMPYGTDASVNLPPGTHEVTVEYVDFEHISFEPPVRASVDVTAQRAAAAGSG